MENEKNQKRIEVEIEVWPNEDGSGVHVINSEMRRVSAGAGEVLHVKVTPTIIDGKQHGRGSIHAWTTGKASDEEERTKSVEEMILDITPKLREFLSDVYAKRPLADSGNEGVFQLCVSVIAFSESDHLPIFSGRIKTAIEEEIL